MIKSFEMPSRYFRDALNGEKAFVGSGMVEIVIRSFRQLCLMFMFGLMLSVLQLKLIKFSAHLDF